MFTSFTSLLGESITYVFMMRSYSADEVNAGAHDSEPDIDADKLFGDTSFSLDDMTHDQVRPFLLLQFNCLFSCFNRF